MERKAKKINMTVQELIDMLSQCDPNAVVTIKYTDHTDYLYFYHVGDEHNPIEECDDEIVDVIYTGEPDFIPDTVEGKAVVINLNVGSAFYGLG
jgi:hypothetical protein